MYVCYTIYIYIKLYILQYIYITIYIYYNIYYIYINRSNYTFHLDVFLFMSSDDFVESSQISHGKFFIGLLMIIRQI